MNYLGEKVLNDSSHPLHPTKTMTITSIRLLDPTAVTLQGAFVFPLKIGEFITGPGLGRGWPGDLVLPQLATQDWKNPTPVVGQTLQPSDDSNAYALALKIVPDQPGTQWVYKGIVIGFTSEGKEYERRVFSSTRGAKNCDDVQEDMEGDREKYMPKPPDEKKTPSATMDLPGH